MVSVPLALLHGRPKTGTEHWLLSESGDEEGGADEVKGLHSPSLLLRDSCPQLLPGGFPSSLLAVHLDSAQHFPPWLNKEAVFAGSEAEVKQWAKPAPIQLKETPVNPHLESLRSIGSFSQT